MWRELIKNLEQAESRQELHNISLELKQTLENSDELIDFLKSAVARVTIVKYPSTNSFYIESQYVFESFDIQITVTEHKLIVLLRNKYNTIKYKGRKWKTALTFKNAYNTVQKYSQTILQQFYFTFKS